MDLIKNKTVIITGASQGIGEATARLFAKLGANVALIARSQEKIEKISDEINNNGGKLIVRAKDSYDGAIPSGNAVAAMNFTRISKFTGDSKWEDIAQNTFLAFSEGIKRIPSAHSFMLTSFMYGLDNPKEIVIVAKEKNAKTMSSIRKIQEVYNPNSIIIFKELKNRSELDNIAPWTAMHDTVNDEMTYYICENFSCRRPTTDIDIAIKYLQ